MRYDTIIIGAGLSGLAAGIRLAYFDRSVCLLERHTTIGGLNSFYRLRGRNHDVGLHAVTNYAAPGTKTGPLSKLLRQLRLSWDDFSLVPQCGSRVDFPGCSLRFSNDFSLLEQEIAENFPSQIDGFRRLVAHIAGHNETSLDRESQSARAVTGEFLSDPLLIDMLFCPLMFYGSATPHDMDFSQFVIMFKSIFQEGFARPREGIRRILKHLVRKYRELGGELRLRAGVQQILMDGERATGVLLDDGTVIEGENILSSAGSAETLRLCPTLTSANETDPPGEISFVETIFSLDCLPASLGHEETIVFYSDTEKFRYDRPTDDCDISSGIICSPNNFQYDEPLEEGCLRITALADPDRWMDLPEAEYLRRKEDWCSRIARAALSHIPDFQPHVLDTDMFTPRTIRKFTGHLNGAVYGAPGKRLDGRTPVDNLYLCGTDQGFLGIIGSMLSGISMANAWLLR